MALVKIISGDQNCGKTTTAAVLEEAARRGGAFTAGFFAEAEYDGSGNKYRYYVKDVRTGDRMLSVCRELPENESTESYRKYPFSGFYFNDLSFDFASGIIDRALESMPDEGLIIIDELGPLELNRLGHFNAVRRLLAGWRGTVCLVIRRSCVSDMLELLNLKAEDCELLSPEENPSCGGR